MCIAYVIGLQEYRVGGVPIRDAVFKTLKEKP